MYKNFFFDRDNTLLYDKGYTYKTEDFKWVEGAKLALKTLTKLQKNIFIVTNQAGIAKGKFTVDEYLNFNSFFLKECERNQIKIKQVYFCPYHVDGVIEEYKKKSEFRKPNPGMINAAHREYSLDKNQSVMIGDSYSDLKAGKNAGIASFLFNQKNIFKFLEYEKLI